MRFRARTVFGSLEKRILWTDNFFPGEGEKEVLPCKQFLFLDDVARNAFNISLHDHYSNLTVRFSITI